jgi:hypothetical protein
VTAEGSGDGPWQDASADDASRWRFERESRTPHSEQWSIETDEYAVGRVDLHFTSGAVLATLAVHESVDEATIEELIAEVDERLVLTADPERTDFVVTVWRGVSYGTFSEDPGGEASEKPTSGGEAE